MSPEFIAAIIAFFGVVISAFVSYAVNLRLTKTQLRKLEVEIRQRYADKLLEKRLEKYPEIYTHLSSFMKDLEKKEITVEHVRSLLKDVNKCESVDSLIFSSETTNIGFRFRKFLTDALSQEEKEIEDFVTGEHAYNFVVGDISSLGLPDDTRRKMEPLKNEVFRRESEFVAELEKLLTSAELDRYRDAILAGTAGSMRILRYKISEFELALKKDIGIFHVDFNKPSEWYRSYGEVNRKLALRQK